MTPNPFTLSTLITLHFSLFTPHFIVCLSTLVSFPKQTFQPFNPSPIQPPSLFTFYPSPEFVSSHLLTNKFFPLPQGARGLFYVTNFSYIQLFNPLHSSLFTLHPSPFTLHPSPFTLHASHLTLIRTYRLIALQSYRLYPETS